MQALATLLMGLLQLSVMRAQHEVVSHSVHIPRPVLLPPCSYHQTGGERWEEYRDGKDGRRQHQWNVHWKPPLLSSQKVERDPLAKSPMPAFMWGGEGGLLETTPSIPPHHTPIIGAFPSNTSKSWKGADFNHTSIPVRYQCNWAGAIFLCSACIYLFFVDFVLDGKYIENYSRRLLFCWSSTTLQEGCEDLVVYAGSICRIGPGMRDQLQD